MNRDFFIAYLDSLGISYTMRRLVQIVRKWDDVNRYSRGLCAEAANELNNLYVCDYVDVGRLLKCANALASALSDDDIIDIWGPIYRPLIWRKWP